MYEEHYRYENFQKKLNEEFGNHAFKKSSVYKFIHKPKVGVPLAIMEVE